MTLLAVGIANPFQGWPILLSVAAPFIIGIAFLGRWVIRRLETVEAEKKALYEKIIEDFLVAINAATGGLNSNTQALTQLLSFIESLKTELQNEKELRVRLEERLQLVDRLEGLYPTRGEINERIRVAESGPSRKRGSHTTS